MIRLSQLDLERFGIVVAKATLKSADEIEATNQACLDQNVDMLIARINSEQLDIAQALEHQGAFLTDVLVYYSRSIGTERERLLNLPDERNGVRIRPCRPEEATVVREMARQSFKGYFGHYHSDRHLDSQSCDDVYVDWAYRSCIDKAVADEVLVAETDGNLIGFATMKMNSGIEAEGVLFGVSPAAQGKGVYRSLIQQSMGWASRLGGGQVVYSTQISNLAVQKVWVREGCEPSHSYLTFHKWFTEPLGG